MAVNNKIAVSFQDVQEITRELVRANFFTPYMAGGGGAGSVAIVYTGGGEGGSSGGEGGSSDPIVEDQPAKQKTNYEIADRISNLIMDD